MALPQPELVRGAREGVRRWVVVAAVLAVLVAAGTAPARAALSPASGPTTGGTTVTGQVAGVTFVQVATSWNTGYGLGSDGVLYAWGDNTYGQVGDGTTTPQPTPVPVDVSGLPAASQPFVQVAAGSGTGYALGSDGVLYAWGRNAFGQVGDGTTTQRLTPVPVDVSGLPTGSQPFVQVAAGAISGYALGSDGALYAWGYNGGGNVGDGTTTQRLTPVPVSVSGLPTGSQPFVQVASRAYTGYALGSDGALYAWGFNVEGQVGDGTTFDRLTPVPVNVSGLPAVSFTLVVAGGYTGYALASDGVLYAWGDNGNGQVGDGSTAQRLTPVPVDVSGLPAASQPFVQVAAGSSTGYGLGSDGVLYAWGYNVFGQVGDGTTTNRATPVPVDVSGLPAGSQPFVQVAAGSVAGYGLGGDGVLYAWGNNNYGQVGDGSTTNRLTPVPVDMEMTVTAVTFDGVAGTGLVTAADGSWSVVTPHGCGPSTVVVSWTQLGVSRTTTYTDGFTFGTSPAVTAQPASAAISPGATFTTSVSVTGDDTPLVQWQKWAGGTWTDVPGATGTTLTVTGLAATTSYRAVATSCWGAGAAATSAVATATVTPDSDGALAASGAPALGLAVSGTALVLAGAGALLVGLRRRSAR